MTVLRSTEYSEYSVLQYSGVLDKALMVRGLLLKNMLSNFYHALETGSIKSTGLLNNKRITFIFLFV
jgi:hypothetical protein